MPTNIIVSVEPDDHETQISFIREIRRAQDLGFSVVPLELRGRFVNQTYRRSRTQSEIFNPDIFNEIQSFIKRASLIAHTRTAPGRLRHDRVTFFMHGGADSGYLGSRQLALLAAACISARPEIFNHVIDGHIIVQIVLVSCYSSGGHWGQKRVAEVFPNVWRWVLTQTGQPKIDIIGRVKGYNTVVTTLQGGHRGSHYIADESDTERDFTDRDYRIQQAQNERGYSIFQTSLPNSNTPDWSDSDVEHIPWTGRTAERDVAPPPNPLQGPITRRRALSAPYGLSNPLPNLAPQRRATTPVPPRRTRVPVQGEDEGAILAPPIELDELFQFDTSLESRLLQCINNLATRRNYFCQYFHQDGFYQLNILIENESMSTGSIQISIRIPEGILARPPRTIWLQTILNETRLREYPEFIAEIINETVIRNLVVNT